MTRTSFDLAIVGGGPAGASAAITAACRGRSVAIFEAGEFPRDKVCGEFVSAESLQLLGNLLRRHPAAERLFAQAPVISSARFFVARGSLSTQINPPGLSIPRYQLDQMLWESAAQAGASAQVRCEVLSSAGQDPFILHTSKGDVSARALLLCAGRWSRFSNPTQPGSGPRWIGLKAHFREPFPPQSTDLYFFNAGYCGVQPVSAYAVNVCAMARSDAATTLDGVIGLSLPLAHRAVRWTSLTKPVTTAPILYRHPEPVRGNILLAGDAAGFIDPFVGDGISLALRTGQAAAICLQPFFEGKATLADAAATYACYYARNFAPLIAASSRVRSLLSLPEAMQVLAAQAFRLPGVLPYVIRRTRLG